MGARERYTSAVGWVADHIAILLFFSAVAGGTIAAVSASMSTLSAYAPFSYVIAALVGAILTTFSIWAVWAFARWVRHGPERTPPIAAESGSRAPPISSSRDTAEAKARLCTFMMDTVTPAVTELQKLFYNCSQMISAWDSTSPQAPYAAAELRSRSPKSPSIDIFGELQYRDLNTLTSLEQSAVAVFFNYASTIATLKYFIYLTKRDQIRQQKYGLNSDIAKWLAKHIALTKELEFMARDIHFPRLKLERDKEAFKPVTQEHFEAFIATEGQSAS